MALLQTGTTVNQIATIAKLYKHFETIELDEHVFPIPKGYNYSYRGTWGSSRGWGGRRIHEGTDIFAGYGVPVVATSYGVIEMMGWNEYGGWRIGIRDNHNTYHYFAHLAYFDKGIKEGDIVKARNTAWYVGSTDMEKKGHPGNSLPIFITECINTMVELNGHSIRIPALRNWERQKEVKDCHTVETAFSLFMIHLMF